MSEASGYVERPDYRVDLLRRRNLVTVRSGDTVIAQTTSPLFVDEQDHGVVVYVPEVDVDFTKLEAIDHRTRCPYKGYASHWQLAGGNEPVAWTYREPHPQVAQIAGHVAFYQDRVSVEIGVATPAVVGYKQ